MTVTAVQQKVLKIIKHDYFHQLILENTATVEFTILVTNDLKLFFLVEDIPLCLSIILKRNKINTLSNTTILHFTNLNIGD
jgi:hypothetical protein